MHVYEPIINHLCFLARIDFFLARAKMLVSASIQLTVLLLLHQQPVEAGQLSQGITGLAMDMASNIGKLGCGHSLQYR